MSEIQAAEIISDRHIQFPEGDIALGEESIVDAIMSNVYQDDPSVLPEVKEAVAQLFDALEEKRVEERESDNAYAVGIAEPLLSADFGAVHYRPDYVEALQQDLADEKATTADLSNQFYELGVFIIREVPGEPSENEGAVATAIRVIRRLQSQAKQIEIVNRTLNDELRSITEYKRKEPPASFTLKDNVPVSYQAQPSGTYSVNAKAA